MFGVQHAPGVVVLGQEQVVETATPGACPQGAAYLVRRAVLVRVVVAEQVQPVVLRPGHLAGILVCVKVAADDGGHGPARARTHPGEQLLHLGGVLPGQQAQMHRKDVEGAKRRLRAGGEGQTAGERRLPAAQVVQSSVAQWKAAEDGDAFFETDGSAMAVGPGVGVGHAQSLGQPGVSVQAAVSRDFLKQGDIHGFLFDEARELLQPFVLPAVLGPIVPQVGAEHRQRRRLRGTSSGRMILKYDGPARLGHSAHRGGERAQKCGSGPVQELGEQASESRPDGV